MKPGINAENERDTDPGTLSGKSDDPVATHHEGEQFRHDQTDNNAGDDVRTAQPVGANGISFAYAIWRHGHEGRHR